MSEEFTSFVRANGIRHVRTPPYYPSSNRLVERAVHTLKTGLKKLKEGAVETKLSRFLFAYRTTPHSATGVSPSELMFGRRLRTAMDNLRPNLSKRVQAGQDQQKSTYDKRARQRQFQVNDLVYVKNYRSGKQWLPGTIVKTLGNTMFEVELTDGGRVRKHADQMRTRAPLTAVAHGEPEDDIDDSLDANITSEDRETSPSHKRSTSNTDSTNNDSTHDDRTNADSSHDGTLRDDPPHDASEAEPESGNQEPPLRRSSRARQPPDRYEL